VDAAAPELDYTVIVPTRDGASRFPAVLEALAGPREAPPHEIVVVDDGSRDDTPRRLAEWAAADPARRRALASGGRGPAAARNAGLAVARGRRVAYLGDDTVPDPDWLREHDRAWRARGATDELAVLGHVRWHERLRLTPFLRFLNDDGLQFGYGLIGRSADPENLPFNFFYTSNVSLDRARAQREPFDERFPYPAWEDVEAAYRLSRAGMRLVYQPLASVAHDHPTDFDRFCRRQERAGAAAVLCYRLHPELGPMLGLGADGPPPLPSPARQRLREALVRALQPLPVAPRRVWREALRFHYIRGLRRGWSERFDGGGERR
jgi:glycosyltransferase involved in cell wall biosynthesis